MIGSPLFPQLMIGAGLLIVFVGAIIAMFTDDSVEQRRLFWVTWALAGTVMSLAGVQQGWGVVALMAAVVMVGVVSWAYFRTPYLKIGGRIYTLSHRHRRDRTNGSTADG